MQLSVSRVACRQYAQKLKPRLLVAALTFSDASSLLVWMKSRQDRVTYPWIAEAEFNDPGLVVFLNDFCDGALVDHTINVCKKRAGFV